MPTLTRIPAIAAILALSACGWVFDGEPDGLKRGREASETQSGVCPQIDGAYRNNGSDLAAMVTRITGTALQLWDWKTVVVTGHPDVAIQLVFARLDRSSDTVTIVRDSGYDCQSGWFHPRNAATLIDEIKAQGRDGSEARERDDRTHRYEFYITSNRRGQLVGKLEDLSFSEFSVWCGDGCKGLPLPWSIRRHVQWTFLPDSSDAVAAQRAPAVADERLLAEERALENGPGLTTFQAWMDGAARDAVQPPVVIRGTGSRDEGLHVSILVPDSTWVPGVVERFRGIAGIRDAWEAPLYKSFTEDRAWQTVIMVTPDSAVIRSLLPPR